MKYLAGYYYHVYNRGCNRERIFANDGSYLFLLRRAKRFLREYPLTVIAYCLMPNHYHFLFRPEEDGSVSPFLSGSSIATPRPSTSSKDAVARCLKASPRACWWILRLMLLRCEGFEPSQGLNLQGSGDSP